MSATSQRQRAARAAQVASRRGVTVFPTRTALQYYEDNPPTVGGPAPVGRDRDILGLRRHVLQSNRREHHDGAAYDPPDTMPSEPVTGFAALMEPDRARLRRLERLEALDRDPSLQAFHDSSVQTQLSGAGEENALLPEKSTAMHRAQRYVKLSPSQLKALRRSLHRQMQGAGVMAGTNIAEQADIPAAFRRVQIYVTRDKRTGSHGYYTNLHTIANEAPETMSDYVAARQRQAVN